MTRGTFANIRIKNLMVPGVEGGVTIHQPDGEQMSIYDAAIKYEDAGIYAVVLAGKEYGTGSSRDDGAHRYAGRSRILREHCTACVATVEFCIRY